MLAPVAAGRCSFFNPFDVRFFQSLLGKKDLALMGSEV